MNTDTSLISKTRKSITCIMSGSENPGNSEGIGFDASNNSNGNKRRKVLFASIIALSLLSLLVLLGNPGLLIPPTNDENTEAEAVGDDNDSDSNDGMLVDLQNDLIDDNSASPINNSLDTDEEPSSDNDVAGVIVESNDGNSEVISDSGSSNGNSDNDATDESAPSTGSGGGNGGGGNGNGGSSHRPTASDGTVTTAEDTPLDIKMNATDLDGNPLTFVIMTVPSHGSLQDLDEATGELTYVPTSGYNGPDSFSFMAKDFRLESDLAVIGITVTPALDSDSDDINDPPVSSDMEVETDEDTPVLIDLLSNVADADGDILSISIVTPPENGDAVPNGDGTVTYTPDQDYYGEDSFTFQANDTMAISNVATVSLTVDSVITIHMESTTISYGSSLFSGRQIYAEYVTDTSSLVGKEIDMIVLDFFRLGNPEGIAEIGVFNEDLSVKRLIGTMNVSTISTSPTEYTFMLPDTDELYVIEVGDRIGIKFDGGSATDNVQVKIDNDPSDPFDGTNSYRTFYSDQWEDRPDGDLWMILINTR